MSESLYELLALFARYIFTGLMVLIVARAWRITIVDSRRAKTLRRISPQTGIIGELMVMEGAEKALRGMKYKVTREGQIGSSRRADIRIRHSSVRRRHAYFILTEEGLRVRAHAGAAPRDDEGEPVREVLLRDGDSIDVGRVQLMLILSRAPEAEPLSPTRRRKRAAGEYPDDDFGSDDLFEPGDDLFDPDDDLFGSDDDPYGPYDEPGFSRPDSYARVSRRRLPFSLEDSSVSGAPYEPLVRRRPSGSASNRSGGYAPRPRKASPGSFRVEDNPLNRRHPRSGLSQKPGYPEDETSDNSEMW